MLRLGLQNINKNNMLLTEVGQFHEQLARQVVEITFSEGRKSRFGSATESV